MAEERERPRPGHRVVGTIKAVKANCSCGHSVGDTFELSGHDTAGLCGFLYDDILPCIIALQFGGKEPWGGAAKMRLECMDRRNAGSIELRTED
jgi:uncharacterized repeat protein (TIGR04076 family)